MEGVDDLDKSASFHVGVCPRRSTSSLEAGTSRAARFSDLSSCRRSGHIGDGPLNFPEGRELPKLGRTGLPGLDEGIANSDVPTLCTKCPHVFWSGGRPRNLVSDVLFDIRGRNIPGSVMWAPVVLTPQASSQRFERSRGCAFGERREESMIGTNQLRLSAARSRVAQPHR
jgi:hypothetical protein